MIRWWLGVALLAGSWMFGLPYFFPAGPVVWVALLLLGAGLLIDGVERAPGRGELLVGLALALAAALLAPWPYAVVPGILGAGLLLAAAPIPRRWPGRLAGGALAAGAVLAAQAAALWLYTAETARSHDLPWPLPEGLAALVRLSGFPAAADGPYVVFSTARQVHRLAATWGLLLDPASLCFFAGGLVMLGLAARSQAAPGERWRAWLSGARRLAVVLAAWLPLRALGMIAVYVHRVVRFDYDVPLHVMNHFLSPWVMLGLLAVPVFLAWRWVQPLAASPNPPLAASQPAPRARLAGAAALVLLSGGLATLAVGWAPPGARQAGRVCFVERHSTWEPTTRPYDTTWYGEDASYNYAAAYDYLGQYYEMSRLLESDRIDDDSLAGIDVLVVKTPTARYARDEVAAVVRFVRRGGGLLLIGDHTNVFDSGTFLNDLARCFGFALRHDQLLGLAASPYDQHYVRPWTAHPIVQHLPPMDFAISNSVDPGRSFGRAAIRNTGLWSMLPEYRHSNYMPVPQQVPEMRYGAFIQTWATRQGAGRVLAFTDSTIFSNFCVYQPGKIELLRDMVEWLNHRGGFEPLPWLLPLALLPLTAGLWVARGRGDAWMLLLAAGLCGWALGGTTAGAMNRRAMPVPDAPRPMTQVVIDRTVSRAPLSKGAFTVGDGAGYGLLEQWIPRLGGCFTRRQRGLDALRGEMLIVITPDGAVTDEFREALTGYVAGGGKLLVIDSPENSSTTANSLLWPFGLSMLHDRAWRGTLALDGTWPGIEVERAWEVTGGEPVARLGQRPVGAMARHGEGIVLAVGFGSVFNDTRMGGTWMLEPDAPTLVRYEAIYALLRRVLEDAPITAPPERQAPRRPPPAPLPDAPPLPDPGGLIEPPGP
jgi:hypothetical protein